jgi:hypothetical protein
MKLFSLAGLLFAAMLFVAVPVTVNDTPAGWRVNVDNAQAQTYRRARVTARRVGRRDYRYARRVNRAAYYRGGGYYAAPRRVCRCY